MTSNRIINAIIGLAVIGLVLWLITLLPIPAMIVQIIYVVAAIGCLLWVLQLFGVIGGPPA